MLNGEMRAAREKGCGRRVAPVEKGCTGVGGSPGRASKREACARIKSTPVSTVGVGEVEDAL
jgi:hypothetical protein